MGKWKIDTVKSSPLISPLYGNPWQTLFLTTTLHQNAINPNTTALEPTISLFWNYVKFKSDVRAIDSPRLTCTSCRTIQVSQNFLNFAAVANISVEIEHFDRDWLISTRKKEFSENCPFNCRPAIIKRLFLIELIRLSRVTQRTIRACTPQQPLRETFRTRQTHPLSIRRNIRTQKFHISTLF